MPQPVSDAQVHFKVPRLVLQCQWAACGADITFPQMLKKTKALDRQWGAAAIATCKLWSASTYGFAAPVAIPYPLFLDLTTSPACKRQGCLLLLRQAQNCTGGKQYSIAFRAVQSSPLRFVWLFAVRSAPPKDKGGETWTMYQGASSNGHARFLGGLVLDCSPSLRILLPLLLI